MPTPIYLGRPAYDPKPYTRIDPIAEASDGYWRAYSDWTEAFPPEGRAFAPRLNGYREGDLLTFGIESNQRGDSGTDRYVVVNPGSVTEVLDFRSVTPEHARRSLVERGLDAMAPGTDSVIAAFGDGTCALVKMVRPPTLGRWMASIDGLDSLTTYALDPRIFEGDRVGGRWIAMPGTTVGVAIGVIDWRRDVDFLEAVLKRLRKGVLPTDVSLTRAQLSQLLTYLSRAEFLPPEQEALTAIDTRLRSFVPILALNMELFDKIVDTVCALRPVKSQLERRRLEIEEDLKRELEDRALQRLEEEMKPLYAERDRLSFEVSELISTLEGEQKKVQKAVEEAERARHIVRDELSLTLAQLTDIPSNAQETIGNLAARIGENLKEQARHFGALAAPGAPWTKPDFDQQSFQDWAKFDEALRASSRRAGYDLTDLMLIDVAARSGELVFLPEHQATGLLGCYVNAISGGDLVHQVLDPSILSVDDLWQQPVTCRPTAFGRAWSAASHDPRRFRVVLLEGLHRTPVDLWLPTLLKLLRDIRRPPNLLVFASIGTTIIDKNRVGPLLEKHLIALSPVAPSGLTPELLSRWSDRKRSYTSFDSTVSPVPDTQELLEALSDYEDGFDGDQLLRLASVYRSALVLKGQIEIAAWLSAFAGSAGVDDPIASRLNKGANWLRGLLHNQE